ncbi:MAG: DinB family protein [Cytophagaceae bacterium]|nr:DinB family protein [Cytophagaceae bacterium]MBK9936041.1 DinB family protein [Cytophagaceae bacterium]MBL0304070.1 DinB family protein [Cytophagaceae bacterium]MBL0326881.1 DinB family protein [Cytophagaceae bacterium]
MSKKALELIIDNLDTVFRGDAWHGPSVMEIINSLPLEKVTQKQQFSSETIAQHVFHLMAWRKFALEKLNDNIHYSLETEEDNWGNAEDIKAENFQILVENLKKSHNALIDSLESYDDELLERNVPGEYYNFYKLLNGIIQHDTYHLGMIWVLWQ